MNVKKMKLRKLERDIQHKRGGANMNITDNSPLKVMLMEHKSIAIKYFYGLDNKWNNDVLISAQMDIKSFYRKYAGDRSKYVQNLSTALYALILERYKESVLFGKHISVIETTAIHHLINSNQLFESLPGFYDKLWILFAKYANGVNGVFTSEGFTQMTEEAIKMFSLEFKSNEDFYNTMISSVMIFWDENIKLRNPHIVTGVA